MLNAKWTTRVVDENEVPEDIVMNSHNNDDDGMVLCLEI